jgi:hypothetical protein
MVRNSCTSSVQHFVTVLEFRFVRKCMTVAFWSRAGERCGESEGYFLYQLQGRGW